MMTVSEEEKQEQEESIRWKATEILIRTFRKLSSSWA
jgi:hypothetical protein